MHGSSRVGRSEFGEIGLFPCRPEHGRVVTSIFRQFPWLSAEASVELALWGNPHGELGDRVDIDSSAPVSLVPWCSDERGYGT